MANELGVPFDAVQVEVYADPQDGGEPFRQVMQRGGQADWYTANVPATRPAGDYTLRVIPFKAGAFVPLEAAEILWQR